MRSWLIAVVLDSEDVYGEAQALLDYGFENWTATVFASAERPFVLRKVFGGDKARVALVPEKTLIEVRPVGATTEVAPSFEFEKLRAPVEVGQVAGRIRLMREGEVVDASALVAAEAVERAWWLGAFYISGRMFLFLGMVVLGLKAYGKTAKIARRRRSRLTPKGGAVDSGRPRKRKREDNEPFGRESGY